ncbi:MAG: V-type ATP synthase subunit I [Vulcanimicrobiota bacterium]
MAISKMSKTYILVARQHKDELLRELQKANFIHVEENLKEEIEVETEEKEILSQHIDLQVSQAEYAIDYLKDYEKKYTLKEKIKKAQKLIYFEKFERAYTENLLEKIYNQVYNLIKKKKDISTEEVELKARLDSLQPYHVPGLSINYIKDTPHTRIRVGSVATKSFKEIHLELEEITNAIAIHIFKEDFTSQNYFLLAYHKDFQDEIDKTLNRHGFKEETFHDIETIEAEFERINHRLKEIENQKNSIRQESLVLADYIDSVRLVYDNLLTIRERKRVENQIYETRSVAILKGWIKNTDKEKLVKLVSGITKFYEIIDMKPEKKESVPVEMANPKSITPMEFVTSLYGTPKYNEFDPTGFIFPFFVLFFAVCLTDAGYGLILLIASILMMRFLGKSKLLNVIMYGAAATIVVGFFAGGFWGINYDSLPEFVRKYSVNLNDYSIEFLVFTIFLGIIQLVFGLFLGSVKNWQQGDKKESVEKVLQALFLGCGATVVVLSALLNKTLPEPFNTIFVYTSLSAGALFFLFEVIMALVGMELEGSIGNKIFTIIKTTFKGILADGGIGVLNSITNFLGNMLSYSRLMALGLATGGIAMVVNIIANLVLEIGGIGWLLFILVLIFGHLFNLVLSSLGAFVHTARLQYVEFFPNFFEGGGRKFNPFNIKTKYHNVVADKEATT